LEKNQLQLDAATFPPTFKLSATFPHNNQQKFIAKRSAPIHGNINNSKL